MGTGRGVTAYWVGVLWGNEHAPGLGRGHSLYGIPGGSEVKNHPATQEFQETQVQSLGGDDPLEEGMATHPSTFA